MAKVRAAGWLSVCLSLLFASPGFAQERSWIAGGAIGVTVEPDAPIYGRVLQGEPLSGSAPAVVVWGGRAMSPRWRLIGEAGIAREFATDALLVAYSVYYTIALHRRHRDVTVMAVGQFNPGAGLWLSLAGGVINARVRQEGTHTTYHYDGRVPNVTTGPVPSRTDSRWELAWGGGAEYRIPLGRRFRVVPSFRVHHFNHDPGATIRVYGLADYTMRLAMGAEFGF